MTLLEAEPLVLGGDTKPEDEICHYVCMVCYPNYPLPPAIAMCGHDVSDEEEIPYDVEVLECVVCVSLEFCPGCGGSNEPEEPDE